MSNFIKSLITKDVDNFRTSVKQTLAEKIVNSLDARKAGISVNLLEASDWILAFDFKSGDKKKVEVDLKKRFKKYFSGSGSMGRGFDLSFHGPKNDLQKIKTYVEKTYKKDLNIKYTTFMAESVAFNEKHTSSHEGSCDEVHPDVSHEEWEESLNKEGKDGGGCGCKKCAELKERTSPLPKSSKFAILFSYAGKDNKFVTKLTNLGGKVDRKKKEVRFDFDNAAARTKFRKKNAAILKNLVPARQLKDTKKES
mgnify:CR=1 FL=1